MRKRKVINPNRLRKWEVAGGVSCFIGGILAASLGSLLTASGWIVGADVHPWLHATGTALLIAAIPLIVFAGFCLDWAERNREKVAQNPEETQRGVEMTKWQQRSNGSSLGGL